MAFIRERDGKFSVVYKIKDDKGKVHQKSETFRKKKDAEALCTKKCTISAYETDKIDIKSSILKELAAVLHCSASYLLEGNKETEVDARLETALKEIDKSGLTEIALIQLKALAMIK